MFNEMQLKQLKSKDTPYKLYEKGSDKGFHIQISPSGKKVFYLAYSINNKKRFYNLGTYSTEFTVKSARAACRCAQKLLDSGIDPQVEHKKRQILQEEDRLEQERNDNAVTVNDILDYYLTKLDNPHTCKNIASQFDSDVRPYIGKLKVIELTDVNVENVIDRVLNRGSNRSARNLYIALNAAFNKARRKTSFSLKRWQNPLNDIEKPKEGDPNDRALNADEVRIFWQYLDSYTGMSDSFKDVLRILLLTGQRVREIIELEWSEIDTNFIDIPPRRIKTGKKTKKGHILPLTPMVLEILNRQPKFGTVVFTGKSDINVSLRWQSLTKALSRMIQKQGKMSSFSPRDIRGTVKTNMARIKIMKEVRDRIQNHSLNDVASKHYDRHDYFEEKLNGLVRWENELKIIVGIDNDKGTRIS